MSGSPYISASLNGKKAREALAVLSGLLREDERALSIFPSRSVSFQLLVVTEHRVMGVDTAYKNDAAKALKRLITADNIKDVRGIRKRGSSTLRVERIEGPVEEYGNLPLDEIDKIVSSVECLRDQDLATAFEQRPESKVEKEAAEPLRQQSHEEEMDVAEALSAARQALYDTLCNVISARRDAPGGEGLLGDSASMRRAIAIMRASKRRTQQEPLEASNTRGTAPAAWIDPWLVNELVAANGRFARAQRESGERFEALERADDRVSMNPYLSERESARLELELTLALEESKAAEEESRNAFERLKTARELWVEAIRPLRTADGNLRVAARLASFEPGTYSVELSRLDPFPASSSGTIEQVVADYLGYRLGFDYEASEDLAAHVLHVGAQPILSGVSLQDAITVKDELSQLGALARIMDSPESSGDGQGRAPIPERVRNEVWRRDSGACVDCGSRERLEFDHIIPVSKGGSNTARNIELRCEKCNRTKAARI